MHTKVTPKDFFLWSGAMIALYVSVFSLITLLFEYINRAYPDALDYYVDPYSGAIRFSMASLVVLFPLFLVLMRLIRNDIVRDSGKKDLWVRRWALFLTVFFAGVSVAITLITLVNYFLGGDITMRFVLKVLVVLLVAAGTFMHFLADIWGFWVKYPQRARSIGWGAGAVVALTVVSGFLIMGSPMQIRAYRLDDQRVGDLQNIQYQIISYWQLKQKLPMTLGELNDPINGNTVPVDPETKQQYVYEGTGPLSFKLCATFSAPAQSNTPGYGNTRIVPAAPMGTPAPDSANSAWGHQAGNTCFTRTIDPQLYPKIPANTKAL